MIYTVTAVARGLNWRTWGWFPTQVEAELAIRADNNDLIFESGTYTHAVIEEVPPGIMGGVDERRTWWYRGDYRGGGDYQVVALETSPQEYGSLTCLSMG